MVLFPLENKNILLNFALELKIDFMKRNKIIFYGATGLLSLMMLASAGMYMFNHEEMSKLFTSLGYPVYIIYPLAVVKILGVIAFWVPNYPTIREWAYAGFFFEFILAFFAHFMISDGEQMGAIMALVLLGLSYFFGKLYKKELG